ncbi:hypothetical protein Tco_0661167 [Tanacetum coccineum]
MNHHPALPNHEQYRPEGRKNSNFCEAKTVNLPYNEPPEGTQGTPLHLGIRIFRSIVYTDHSAIKYLFAKKMLRQDSCGGIYCTKNLILEILDKTERESRHADHLSRLKTASRQTREQRHQ